MIKKNEKPLNILITAGPTREYLDPVRFISNPSTGVMGYALAQEAVRRGHKVRLISGPVAINPPAGVEPVYIVSARQMYKKVLDSFEWCHCLIMSAAICDYRPVRMLKKKMSGQAGKMSLALVKNKDILREVSKKKKPGQVLVGFALQTDNLLKKAGWKLVEKKLDIIVANKAGKSNCPFGTGLTSVALIDKQGNITKLNKVKKDFFSVFLLDKAEQLCYTLSRSLAASKLSR